MAAMKAAVAAVQEACLPVVLILTTQPLIQSLLVGQEDKTMMAVLLHLALMRKRSAAAAGATAAPALRVDRVAAEPDINLLEEVDLALLDKETMDRMDPGGT